MEMNEQILKEATHVYDFLLEDLTLLSGGNFTTLLFGLPVLYPQANSDWMKNVFLDNFLGGYQLEKMFDQTWFNHLPFLINLLELSQYLTLLPGYRPEQSDGWVGRYMANRAERIRMNIPHVNLPLF